MTEKWLSTHGLEVSDRGNVRSQGGAVKTFIDGRGYRNVRSLGRTWRVHRLVAAAFIGESDLLVRHMDGDQLNNALWNLSYGTTSENAFDSVRHGTHFLRARTKCKNGHEYTEENTRMYLNRRICRACDRSRSAELKKRKLGAS